MAITFREYMKIKEYLKKHNMTTEAFSIKADTSYTTCVKWIYQSRIPSKNYMKKIYQITGGKVSANDFYDLGKNETLKK